MSSWGSNLVEDDSFWSQAAESVDAICNSYTTQQQQQQSIHRPPLPPARPVPSTQPSAAAANDWQQQQLQRHNQPSSTASTATSPSSHPTTVSSSSQHNPRSSLATALSQQHHAHSPSNTTTTPIRTSRPPPPTQSHSQPALGGLPLSAYIPADFDQAFNQPTANRSPPLTQPHMHQHTTQQPQQQQQQQHSSYKRPPQPSSHPNSSPSTTQQPYKRQAVNTAPLTPSNPHTPYTLASSTTTTLSLSSSSAPVCQGHGEPMRELTVKKDGPTQGRRFFKCSNATNPCNSFEWSDSLQQRTLNPPPSASSQPQSQLQSQQQQQQRVTVMVHMELVDATEYSVSFHPFSTHLIELFKSQQGRYNDTQKHWVFPLTQYDTLFTALQTLQTSNNHHLSLDLSDDIPRNLRRFLTKPLPNPPHIDDSAFHSVLPKALINALLPFQLNGVRFALSKGGKLALADEMGVGKSVQAIAVMSWYSNDWPVLIVCPSSLRLNWKGEILKWYTEVDGDDSKTGSGQLDMDGRIDIIMKGSDEKLMEARLRDTDKRYITIISYDLVPKLHKTIEIINYGITIADESHMVKSHTAKRTKALLPILKNSRRTLLLSGTPALNRPAELFTQLHALMPELFTSFQSFGNRYCDPQHSKWGKTYDGGTHLHELHYIIKRYVMIRRLKCDVLSQLPPKRRQAVIVECQLDEMKREMKGMNNKMEANIRQFVNQQNDTTTDTALISEERKDNTSKGSSGSGWKGDIMHLFTLTAKAKEKVVVEYCIELLESLDKFLVFFHHTSLADTLADTLHKHNTSFIRIDGSTPVATRQQYVDSFQTDPSIRIGLLSITAASTGFTLHAASTVIFAELFWSPAWLLQAEDRVHRIGTTAACVNIQYILGKGTVDELIWPLLCSKLECLSLALNGMKSDAAMGIDAVTDTRQDDGNGNGNGRGSSGVSGAGQKGIRGYMQQQAAL